MSKETIDYLPVGAIDTKPQVRESASDDSIRNLAVALKEVGQLQPIRVQRSGERFIAVDGERRLHAARLLQWESIAAIIEERELNSSETVQRQLIANCMRKNLSSMEIARAIETLIEETGWSASEVAGKLGFSAATVSKLRALLDLPATIQEQVQNGSLATSTAYVLGKVDDPARQAELVQEAASGALTRDAANAKAKRRPNPSKRTKRARPANIYATISGNRVSMSGRNLNSIETVIALLEELVGKAKAAHAGGMGLEEFLKNLKTAA